MVLRNAFSTYLEPSACLLEDEDKPGDDDDDDGDNDGI